MILNETTRKLFQQKLIESFTAKSILRKLMAIESIKKQPFFGDNKKCRTDEIIVQLPRKLSNWGV